MNTDSLPQKLDPPNFGLSPGIRLGFEHVLCFWHKHKYQPPPKDYLQISARSFHVRSDRKSA